MSAFLRASVVRAARTFAQVVAAAIPTTAVSLGEVSWGLIFSTAAVAAIGSLATSVATGLPEVGKHSIPDAPAVTDPDSLIKQLR